MHRISEVTSLHSLECCFSKCQQPSQTVSRTRSEIWRDLAHRTNNRIFRTSIDER